MHQLFSVHGQIYKIVIFTKSNGLQALVQFSKVEEAQKARSALFGVWPNVQFSHLRDLTVKENSERMRDFTNPDLGWSYGDLTGAGALFSASPLVTAMTPLSAPSPIHSMISVQQQPQQQLTANMAAMSLSSSSPPLPAITSSDVNSMTNTSTTASKNANDSSASDANDAYQNHGEKSVLLVSNFSESVCNFYDYILFLQISC